MLTVTLRLLRFAAIKYADSPGYFPYGSPTKGGPLAVFVHLSGDDPGQIFTQFDGWDTAVTTLEPGDIIEQQVTLWPPAETPSGAAFLRVGLYSPQTGQRFPLVDGRGDFETLGPVIIQNE